MKLSSCVLVLVACSTVAAVDHHLLNGGTNKKCADDNDRVFEVQGPMTLDECFTKCNADPACNYYSFATSVSEHAGMCSGCNAGNLEDQQDWNAYAAKEANVNIHKGRGLAKEGHDKFLASKMNQALDKYTSGYNAFLAVLGSDSLRTEGMNQRASLMNVAAGGTPLTTLDPKYPASQLKTGESGVHQGRCPSALPTIKNGTPRPKSIVKGFHGNHDVDRAGSIAVVDCANGDQNLEGDHKVVFFRCDYNKTAPTGYSWVAHGKCEKKYPVIDVRTCAEITVTGTKMTNGVYRRINRAGSDCWGQSSNHESCTVYFLVGDYNGFQNRLSGCGSRTADAPFETQGIWSKKSKCNDGQHYSISFYRKARNNDYGWQLNSRPEDSSRGLLVAKKMACAKTWVYDYTAPNGEEAYTGRNHKANFPSYGFGMQVPSERCTNPPNCIRWDNRANGTPPLCSYRAWKAGGSPTTEKGHPVVDATCCICGDGYNEAGIQFAKTSVIGNNNFLTVPDPEYACMGSFPYRGMGVSTDARYIPEQGWLPAYGSHTNWDASTSLAKCTKVASDDGGWTHETGL